MSSAPGNKLATNYLGKYGEPESLLAQTLHVDRYPHCLVIPAFDEQWQDIATAVANITTRFLLVLVANAPSDVDEKTRRLLSDTENAGHRIWAHENIALIETTHPFDILLVDRCSPDRHLPKRRGVGLARKIGADIALALITKSLVEEPVIYCSDADVVLPPDYFTACKDNGETAAWLYPFVHVPTKGHDQASLLYEISLLYYVAGLQYADSPYAFLSIGSTMALSAQHYARVRGFPRRNAAEDFYLLNKLAKSGRIQQHPAPQIRIAGRPSHRVPFGTGAGIRKITDLASPLQEFTFYDPRVFSLLRELLDCLDSSWDDPDLRHTELCSPPVRQWLLDNQVPAVIRRFRTTAKRRQVFNKHITDWFDGFRTMKFVHEMQANGLPRRPLSEILSSPILKDVSPSHSLAEIRQRLAVQIFGNSPKGELHALADSSTVS